MSEEHLDFLAAMPGRFVVRRDGNSSSDMAGVFVEITPQLARRRIRAAALFEFAGVTVFLARAIEPTPFTHDPRSRRRLGSVELFELFAYLANLAIMLTIPFEV